MRARSDRPIKIDQEEHMVFGPMRNSVHNLKRNFGLGPQHVSSDELASYSNPSEVLIIAVEYESKDGEVIVLKYKSKARALSFLYNKHQSACKQMHATKSLWSSYKLSPSRMTHLGNSCDAESVSRYCLISGINTSNLSGGILSDALIAKLRKAAKGYKVTASPDEDYLTDIKHKRHRSMKLSSMGWKETKNEKAIILVKLSVPILTGITMAGGRRRCASPPQETPMNGTADSSSQIGRRISSKRWRPSRCRRLRASLWVV
jgi:hypothetical protein